MKCGAVWAVTYMLALAVHLNRAQLSPEASNEVKPSRSPQLFSFARNDDRFLMTMYINILILTTHFTWPFNAV